MAFDGTLSQRTFEIAKLQDLSEADRAPFAELKQWGQIMLLQYDAHYGPGGPYEGLHREKNE
jgi:hypothetical protein